MHSYAKSLRWSEWVFIIRSSRASPAFKSECETSYMLGSYIFFCSRICCSDGYGSIPMGSLPTQKGLFLTWGSDKHYFLLMLLHTTKVLFSWQLIACQRNRPRTKLIDSYPKGFLAQKDAIQKIGPRGAVLFLLWTVMFNNRSISGITNTPV